MKYKFEETQGCTADCLSVNGELFYDLPTEKQEEIVDYLLTQIKESYKDHAVELTDLLHLLQYTDYKIDKEYCDQCGDSIATTTWEL